MGVMTILEKVMSEKQEEFLDTMLSLKVERLTEKGIRGSRVNRDGEEETGFRLIDEWETDEDLERYCSGEDFRVLLGALRTLFTETEVK